MTADPAGADPAGAAARRLAETVRVEGAHVLAALTRTTGDLALAEDALQEASIAALQTWPRTGVPDEPRAWLLVTARRRALDALRREAARTGKEAAAAALADQLRAEPVAGPGDSSLGGTTSPDEPGRDLLRLVFTCCHPSLARETQVALALRTLCGLSTGEIAAVTLGSEPAVAKRLVRARQKIARAGIPYRVPADAELPDRLPAVAAVVHALFTAGYRGRAGGELVRLDLCAEALRLADLLCALMPGEPTLLGLHALLLLTHARRDARVDDAGDLVLLADQDRGRWHDGELALGRERLQDSLRRSDGLADRWQLEAAVAAQHTHRAGCDWAEVVRLYDLLTTVAPSPAVALARAVAIGERDGAAAGLAALGHVQGLDDRHLLHAVRADLLRRLGDDEAASSAYEQALACGPSAAEERFLRRRLAEVTPVPLSRA